MNKCPECNGCMNPRLEGGTLVWNCEFCRQDYMRLPGKKGFVEYSLLELGLEKYKNIWKNLADK